MRLDVRLDRVLAYMALYSISFMEDVIRESWYREEDSTIDYDMLKTNLICSVKYENILKSLRFLFIHMPLFATLLHRVMLSKEEEFVPENSSNQFILDLGNQLFREDKNSSEYINSDITEFRDILFKQLDTYIKSMNRIKVDLSSCLNSHSKDLSSSESRVYLEKSEFPKLCINPPELSEGEKTLTLGIYLPGSLNRTLTLLKNIS